MLASFGLLGVNNSIKAEDKVAEFWDDTKISGDIRSYYFTRDYTNPAKTDQAAYSLGGNLSILTGSFWSGFRLGVVAYTAQPLGLNSNDPAKIDTTLPGTSLNALGQAYLEYNHSGFLVRGGDQLINTPWLNAADSRMIPATYRGFFGTWAPKKDWLITALRIYEFKSRVADDFSATNIYNPENMGIPIPGLGTIPNPGAQALGVNYEHDAIKAQAWGYQFFNFAKLFYTDAQYTFGKKSGEEKSTIHPFIGAQFLTEGGDGDNILELVSTGKANSTVYGAIVGVEMPYAKLSLAYNHMPVDPNAYNNGVVVSPYTYTSDPLYTTSMIAGLVDKTAGDAWKAAAVFYAFDKQLQFITSFAQYYTQPYLANTDETDLDLTYSFKKSKYKSLRGLSIRNRLGILSGDPTKGTFYYNRVMVQYSF